MSARNKFNLSVPHLLLVSSESWITMHMNNHLQVKVITWHQGYLVEVIVTLESSWKSFSFHQADHFLRQSPKKKNKKKAFQGKASVCRCTNIHKKKRPFFKRDNFKTKVGTDIMSLDMDMWEMKVCIELLTDNSLTKIPNGTRIQKYQSSKPTITWRQLPTPIRNWCGHFYTLYVLIFSYYCSKQAFIDL